MKIIKSLIIHFTLILTCTMCLTACNTMQGLGKDLQEGGQKLQKSAHENS